MTQRTVLRRGRPRAAGLRILLAVCTIYGLLASIALLAVVTLRDATTWTYVLGLLYFWWLCPAPLALVAALATRSLRVAAAVLLPAAAAVYLLGPSLVNTVAPRSNAAADLRVATFNLTNARPLDGLMSLVSRDRPDVLLLQEVTATQAQLPAMLPGYRYASAAPKGPEHDSTAVVSRFPILSTKPITGLPAGARPADVVIVDVHGRHVALLSVHLASPCIGCPAGANAAGTTGQAARLRVTEARRYAAVIQQLNRSGQPLILGGDLNSSPLNEPLRELTEAGPVDSQRVGTGLGFTRGPGPGVARVDVVLVQGFDVLRVAEGARGSSTHSPVIADLAWATDSWAPSGEGATASRLRDGRIPSGLGTAAGGYPRAGRRRASVDGHDRRPYSPVERRRAARAAPVVPVRADTSPTGSRRGRCRREWNTTVRLPTTETAAFACTP